MVILNFFGDFLAPSVDGLSIGANLKRILDNGSYNVVNCEAPCISAESKKTTIVKSGPSLFQDIKTPEWLKKNKFNIISLSNNHIMDFGEMGLESTREAFKGEMIIGAGEWEDAYKPQIVECEGKIIAIFAFTQYEFGTLADRITDKKGAALLSHPEIIGRILETRKHVDYLYIFAHAGVENIEQPLPEWREVYKGFIDIGCDGVIASHPHIIQGWEFYKEKPIVYSLGNFYFKTKKQKTTTWYRNLCFSINIDCDVISYNVTPLSFTDKLIDVDSTKETKDYIERVNQTLSDDSEYMNYINRVCDNMLESYYNLFLAGGFLRVNRIHKIVKPIAKLILRGKSHEIVHAINNIRCESHRWAIMRAMKNRHNIL